MKFLGFGGHYMTSNSQTEPWILVSHFVYSMTEKAFWEGDQAHPGDTCHITVTPKYQTYSALKNNYYYSR